MRSATLSKALSGANSPKDYADMANGQVSVKTHSYTHQPYSCGGHNLITEYTKLLKQKGVRL